MQAPNESVFVVEDMFCGGCAATVERAVRRLPGVVDVSVSFLSDTATVQHHVDVVGDSSIRTVIAQLGYTTRAIDDPAHTSQSSKFEKQMRMRLGVALGFGLWVMMASMIRLFIGLPTETMAWWFAVFSGIVSLPVLLYSAAPFLKLGWLGLRARVPGMDSLIFVATVAATLGSLVTLANGGSDVWFDVPVMLVTFQLIARLADFGAHRTATNAVRELLDLSPVKARRVIDLSTSELVPLSVLVVGDNIQSHAGERICMDGVVIAGSASVDAGLLNGESMPELRQPGDEIHAGMLNLNGTLTLRVTSTLGNRRMDILASSVGSFLNKKTNLMSIADSVAFWLVPLLLLLALVVSMVLLALGSSVSDTLERALAVLVVSCPCALSLAVPLVVSVTAARAAREGILLRDASVLDKARRVDTLLLDKTGTLTVGKPTVQSVHAAAGFSKNDVIERAALAGKGSQHPLMLAIRQAAALLSDQSCEQADAINQALDTTFTEHPGKGVCCKLASGVEIRAGSRQWLSASVPSMVELSSSETDALSHASEVCVVFNGQYVGAVFLADELRKDACRLISQLKRRGADIKLVSGDRPESVRIVADTLGIDWEAQASPEDKAALVERLTEQGRVVGFVGDGLNDGPALAASSLGIATGKASDLAKNAAAMAVLDGGLDRILVALQITSKASQVLRSNILLALAYNALMLPAALFGYVHPVMAVLAMALSTLSVTLNSLRAGTRRYGQSHGK